MKKNLSPEKRANASPAPPSKNIIVRPRPLRKASSMSFLSEETVDDDDDLVADETEEVKPTNVVSKNTVRKSTTGIPSMQAAA